MTEAGASLAALVRAAAAERPDAPAVVAGDQRLTWGELDAAVDRAAAGYAALGMAPGDRVAVQLPNGVPWLRAALGALRAGLVVVPVNTAYTDPELEYVLSDSGAALLVASADRQPVGGVRVCPGPPDDDEPGPQGAQRGPQPRHAVGQLDGDAVARPQVPRGVARGRPVHRGVQLRPAQPLLARDHGRCVGSPAGGRPHERGERRACLGHWTSPPLELLAATRRCTGGASERPDVDGLWRCCHHGASPAARAPVP